MATAPRVIIITGASRGIGHAIATFLLGLSSPPVNVVLLARTQAPLESLRAQYPDKVQVLAGDIVHSSSLAKQAVQLAIENWARLDGLILNHATMNPVLRLAESTAAGWNEGFRVNLFSCVDFIREALPHLRASKGRILITSSGSSVRGYAGCGAYGAAKAAVNHLVLTIAAEEPDVVAIAVRPGVVDTEMQREIREVYHVTMDENDRKKFSTLKEEGKLLRPEQPGTVMARLVLEAKKELSGRFLNWDDQEVEKFLEK